MRRKYVMSIMALHDGDRSREAYYGHKGYKEAA